MCLRGRLAQFACLVATVIIVTCIAVSYFKLYKKATWGYYPVRGVQAAPTKLILPVNVTRSFTARLDAVHHKQKPTKESPPSPPAPVEMGCLDLKNMDKEKVLVLGHRRKEKGFLTIGIPHTSQSAGQHHLRQTLESLIKNLPGITERSQVTIVVLSSTLNPSSQQEARGIVSSFPEHVQSGLLQLVEAPRSFYPSNVAAAAPGVALAGSPAWAQVKQCVEGAFLLTYVTDISGYYLQLSDDVRAAPNYTRSMRDFIQQRNGGYWVMLEFIPELGTTGKLIRGGGRDLQQLVHLLVEFNQYRTFGEIYNSFRSLNVQNQVFSFKPPLFYPW